MTRRRAAPAATAPGCFDRALRLLAHRAHFRRELEAKLERRGYAGDEIEAACDRLRESGLLDDEACARSLASGPYRRRGLGPLRVRAELTRRGAPQEVVERVVAEGFPDGGLEPALVLARRWLERRPPDGVRLARHLAAKGYGESAVRRALDRLGLRWSPGVAGDRE